MGEIDITKILIQVLTTGTSGAIIKIVLMVASIGFSFWWKFKIDKIKAEAARERESAEDRMNHERSIEQNNTDNNQIKSDSQRADDFLNGGKNE